MNIKKTILWKVARWIYYNFSITYIIKIIHALFARYDNLSAEHLKHFGKDFPEKTFYVIRRAGKISGLLSDFHHIVNHISYALSKGYVPVVNMENYTKQHKQRKPIDIGGVITSNAWEYYFEQPCGYSLKDIKNAKNVILSDMGNFNAANIVKWPNMFDDEADMSKYNPIVTQYCRINQKTMDYINKAKELLFNDKNNILGILYRATTYINAKNHPIQASMEQMIEKISLVLHNEKFDYIYICTESQEMVDELYKSFPKEKIICLNRERFSKANYIFTLDLIHHQKNLDFQLELDYLTEVYLLSQCDGLIASNKTMGWIYAVGINNNKYRYNHTFDFGVDNIMGKTDKIYVAGHTGLVGSAIMRQLQKCGYEKIITRTHPKLNLTDAKAVEKFFRKEKPDYVFCAAAVVGGLHANDKYMADFAMKNLKIAINLIDSAYKNHVKKLLYLGSSCIYPRECPQPVKEEYLLTGPLEPTNEGYALAKITGVKLCDYYKKQYRANFISCMPANLYGSNDSYDESRNHVVPALIQRFHHAKVNNLPSVEIWGTGNARREFMYVDDAAEACVFLMNTYYGPGIINVGNGNDISIAELAQYISDTVGYNGKIVFDTSKPDGMPRRCLDSSKILSMGWNAKTPFKEGLKKAYEWYLANVYEVDK